MYDFDIKYLYTAFKSPWISLLPKLKNWTLYNDYQLKKEQQNSSLTIHAEKEVY
jgi:hypothetical protein